MTIRQMMALQHDASIPRHLRLSITIIQADCRSAMLPCASFNRHADSETPMHLTQNFSLSSEIDDALMHKRLHFQLAPTNNNRMPQATNAKFRLQAFRTLLDAVGTIWPAREWLGKKSYCTKTYRDLAERSLL